MISAQMPRQIEWFDPPPGMRCPQILSSLPSLWSDPPLVLCCFDHPCAENSKQNSFQRGVAGLVMGLWREGAKEVFRVVFQETRL